MLRCRGNPVHAGCTVLLSCNAAHFKCLRLVYCSSSYSAYKYIPSSILAGLVEGKEINSERQLSLIVIATSDKDLDVIMKSPKVCQIDPPFRIKDSDIRRVE